MIKQKKPLRAKNKKTYIAFVLDKSSSMAPLQEATITAFNEQMDEHRKSGSLGGQTSISLVQFSGQVEETFFNIPIDELEGNLDASQYVPCGSTALLDALGYTITKLQRFDEPGDVGFLVVVLSDGEENCSRKYSNNDIVALRKELEATGRWTFQYIGCDPNGLKEAANLGFQRYAYSPTVAGMGKLSADLRGSTKSYYDSRSIGHTACCNFMSDNETPVKKQLLDDLSDQKDS